MSEKVVVIYHRDCFDGTAAAWVAWKYFAPRNVDVIFYPENYGNDPPYAMCAGLKTYILDFSYPRQKLIKLKFIAADLLVLDHHKTAEEDLRGLPYTIFDMNRSGAGLAWDWFFAGKPRNWLVDTIEDRDLWRFAYPESRALMAWVATIPMTVDAYDALSHGDPQTLRMHGEAILRYIEKYGKKASEHALFKMIGGSIFPVMNMSYQNCSDHLNAFIENSNGLHDRAASFFLTKDNRWQFSLRSVGDFDVAEIAKKFGGGGHKNAAGFTVDVLPWLTEPTKICNN